mmetsp:Transcript_6685/g.12468  ORF Transcript_6685/g.12468 Transcript_6685/m.12468 type:complete len:84 (+) Transcript_6685:459-710(+)
MEPQWWAAGWDLDDIILAVINDVRNLLDVFVTVSRHVYDARHRPPFLDDLVCTGRRRSPHPPAAIIMARSSSASLRHHVPSYL